MVVAANHNNIPTGVSLAAGGIAGAVEAATTYPFEFAKTRVQLRNDEATSTASSTASRASITNSSSSTSKPSQSAAAAKRQRAPNPFAVVRDVVRHEGARALYKGCGSLVVGSIAKDGVRFVSFDAIKNAYKDKETGTLTPLRNMAAGMSAGVVASVCAVTPTERIKTALIDDARRARRFTSTLHCVRSVVAEDGLVGGLYRGFVGTTLKQASATAFRMGTYNILKDFERTRHIEQGVATNFANGMVAGVVTTYATQPFDTLKTRSQSARGATTVEAFASILADHGVRGFWKGTVMRLGRTIMAGGILFTVYEQMVQILMPIMAPEGRMLQD
ncbi:tricarboxylate transport protein, mitochondrial precursor [Phyllosticta citribraziliensis]|uniref:Tricarboxylate transport protein, mitochondrial n=1 Tax=Phyllosticta citribraziliensis TaxID=989973 RepID=A0ABR1M9Y5_9PEZI